MGARSTVVVCVLLLLAGARQVHVPTLPVPVVVYPRNGEEITAQNSGTALQAKFTMRITPQADVVQRYSCQFDLLVSHSGNDPDEQRYRAARSQIGVTLRGAGTYFLAVRYVCATQEKEVVGPDTWLIVDVVPANATRVFPSRNVSQIGEVRHTHEEELLLRRIRILFIGDMGPSKTTASF